MILIFTFFDFLVAREQIVEWYSFSVKSSNANLEFFWMPCLFHPKIQICPILSLRQSFEASRKPYD